MNWKPIETAPKEGCFLVYMPEARGGKKVQVAYYHPNVNIIGNAFDFDMPKPTLWAEIVMPECGKS